jgi:hypothetical protein
MTWQNSARIFLDHVITATQAARGSWVPEAA